MTMQTANLRPDTSMIEVMRRFRAQPEATIIRAKHARGHNGKPDFWSIQFVGSAPDPHGLISEGAP